MGARPTDRGFEIVRGDATLRVEFCTPGIVRIRGWHGPEPPMNALLRYDLWTREWPPVDVATDVGACTGSAASNLLRVSLGDRKRSHGDGTLTISAADGEELLQGFEPPMLGPDPGFRARFALPDDERCPESYSRREGSEWYWCETHFRRLLQAVDDRQDRG